MGWGQALGMAPVPPHTPKPVLVGQKLGTPTCGWHQPLGTSPLPARAPQALVLPWGKGMGHVAGTLLGTPSSLTSHRPHAGDTPVTPPSTALCPTPSQVAILGSVPLPPSPVPPRYPGTSSTPTPGAPGTLAPLIPLLPQWPCRYPWDPSAPTHHAPGTPV